MIPSQRALFDIPADVTYLNCAYMSPLMRHVVEIGERAVAAKARPWTITPPDFFAAPEEGRRLFARLINADDDDIAVVPAVSYGVAVAARNLAPRAGGRILVLEDQFPSMVYGWRELAAAGGGSVETVRRGNHAGIGEALLEAIRPGVSIVACGNLLWTDGSLIDLVAVGARCREVGAALVLDLTQSIGATPFDVAAVDPDFAVAAGYKWMMGPYSLGFLYVAPRWQAGEPIEHNWIARRGSENFAALVDYQDDYQPGARRFDVGEVANFALQPMANAALAQLLEWGVENIRTTLRARTDMLAERAGALGLTCAPRELRAAHFLGLRFPGGPPDGLLERLAERRIHVSLRGDSMRVTPHLYNDEGDIDRLIAALSAELGRSEG